MATAKATTSRTDSTATAAAKVGTGAGSVDVGAVIDLEKVRKPFYAYVGVADLAVEKLRTLPEVYVQSVSSAQAQMNQARGSVKTLPDTVLEQLQTLPTKAREAYDDLVKRGQKIVTTVRNNPNTQAAVQQAKIAGSQAKSAAAAARHSVQSAEKAVEDTAAETAE